MKITDVETIPIDNRGHGRLGYLILVRTDEGITGLGEAAADCHPGTVAHAIRQMPLKGRNPMAIETILAGHVSGHILAGWPHLVQRDQWRGTGLVGYKGKSAWNPGL